MQQKLVSFDVVRSNNVKTTFLILFFIGFAAAMGLLLGYFWGNSYAGLIVATIVAVIYSIIAYHNSTNMIMSLVKAKPVSRQEDPFLINTVEGLSIAAGLRKPPKVYIINDSALNAFATGTNEDNAAIAVTSGLRQKLNRAELEGVVAHELAHIKHKDTKTMVVAAIITGVIVLIADILIRSVLYSRDEKKNPALLIVGLVLAVLSPIIAEAIRLAISRSREYAADAQAAIMTRYPKGLADALRKIASDPDPLVDTANRATAHLFISTPFRKKKGFFTNMFSTHPPIEERIRRLESM